MTLRVTGMSASRLEIDFRSRLLQKNNLSLFVLHNLHHSTLHNPTLPLHKKHLAKNQIRSTIKNAFHCHSQRGAGNYRNHCDGSANRKRRQWSREGGKCVQIDDYEKQCLPSR